MSAFKKGEKLHANVEAQGMIKGEIYSVEDIDELTTPFGSFFTYHLRSAAGARLSVRNAHLLLDRA